MRTSRSRTAADGPPSRARPPRGLEKTHARIGCRSGRRLDIACLLGTVQEHDGHAHVARALSGRGAGSHRPTCAAGAGLLRHAADTMEYIKAGRLRALAVTGATRTQALPDVPTIGEFVPGYEAVGWLGIVAPKDTPAAIIDMVNNAINAGLADPKIKQTIADWGETVLASSPAEFGKFLAAENEKWGKVIRAANIKL
jgi:Tripartite tricarboxylate transporter family receptor